MSEVSVSTIPIKAETHIFLPSCRLLLVYVHSIVPHNFILTGGLISMMIENVECVQDL